MGLHFEIPIDAMPQQRPRVYGKVAVDPPKCKQFKQNLAMLVKSFRRGSSLLEGELKVEIHIYRKFKVTSKRYGDIDNLTKGILDALTGVLWLDDKQISSLFVTKNLSDTPLIVLDVEEVFK